jgi:hypothetical protein
MNTWPARLLVWQSTHPRVVAMCFPRAIVSGSLRKATAAGFTSYVFRMRVSVMP